MDFSLDEMQTIAVDGFQKFLQAEIKPIAEQYRDKYINTELAKEIQAKLAPFGVVNGFLPEELGGFDMDLVTQGMLMHELAKVSPDIAITTLIYFASGKMVAATPEPLRSKYLDKFLSCELIASVAISEPGTGSDISSASCRAKQDGDYFVINGEKMWISSGDYSDFMYVLVNVTEGDETGLAVFLVDRNEHGYETTNIDKTALNSQSTAQVFFDNCRVPKENMVAAPGKGLKMLLTLLQSSRPIVGLMSMGIAQAAFDEALQYALDRSQFGKPIAAKQIVQEKLAEMITKIEAGKLMAYRALDCIAKGKRSDIDAAMAKWYCTDMACEIVDEATKIHGGNGITREFPVEYMARAAKVFRVTEGTNEIQKLMIGRAITGLNAF
ncbi:acyl-CoA dehydrogenase family protein [Thalassotalea sp. Y01]|uniref:acyl-CoA dehydrogenase family protein n=1 Tax=Thalassotalea sp. Y01 TaxID=2729613 RepID=UPI00145C5722|nr:acyl-CoA dehydrogenase family protein [Thalassotalea sp. Y01]NMP14749.1 acyl-CoA/acyl-ACP dehydrogenase [Thalassotalea sp. Y01]